MEGTTGLFLSISCCTSCTRYNSEYQKLPFTHSCSLTAPTLMVVLPSLHLRQRVCVVCGWYVEVGHFSHFLLWNEKNEPVEQSIKKIIKNETSIDSWKSTVDCIQYLPSHTYEQNKNFEFRDRKKP